LTEPLKAQVNPLLPTVRAGKSKEQYYAEIRAKRTHTCLHCKKEYVSKRRHLNEGIKFCSRECAYAMKALLAQAPFTKIVFNLCVVCAKEWAAKRTRATCSSECGNEKAMQSYREWYEKEVESRPLKNCKQCNALFKPIHGAECCSVKCSRKHGKTGRRNTERAEFYGVEVTRFNEIKILERDKWRCQLCGIKTPERLRGKHLPNSPEIDHIIPLSQGGSHTQHNVQCVCRSCNSEKGNRPLGQLLLPC
jgi:5-methylcytosine-specific restriction endonuclease McrA